MAGRRMFARSVVGSARFLRMPQSSRLLYYDLGMAADDDGVVEAFSVMRTTGASEDDLRVLAARQFVKVMNEDLVSVILDWKKNNQIRKDRYTPTIYQKELFELGITSNSNFLGLPDGNQNAVFDNQNGNQRETQVRIVQVNTLSSELADREPDKSESKERAKKLFPPDSDAYLAACCLRDEIAQRLPTSTPPSEKQLQTWADAFDKCNRIDGHGWEEIERVLLFSQDDPFWQKNILSGGSFRKHFTALLARMEGG